MKTKIMFLLIVCTLSACKKNTQILIPSIPNVEQPQTAPRPMTGVKTKNINGHSIITAIGYSSLAKVNEETTMDQTTGSEMNQLFRYKDGAVYRSDIFQDDRRTNRIDYLFTGQRLETMRYLEIDNKLNAEITFELHFTYKNQILEKISTKNPQGIETGYTIFTFQDGNVSQTKTYSSMGELISSTSFTYDKKTNPYLRHPGYLHAITAYNKNNITSTRLNDPIRGKIQTNYYTYDYNKSGQPVNMYTSTENQSPNLTSTFSYQT